MRVSHRSGVEKEPARGGRPEAGEDLRRPVGSGSTSFFRARKRNVSLMEWWQARSRRKKELLAEERRVDRLVQSVVDRVDPRMRGLGGYQRRLAPAIAEAARFAGTLVEALPEPVQIARDRWANEPCLRACFANVDTMQELFDQDRVLQRFLSGAEAQGAKQIFATVGMRVDRRSRHGFALSGDLLQKGVEQVAVSFSDHRIGVIAADETSFRAGLQRRVLEELATRAMQRIMGMQTRRESLTEQQATLRWKLKIYEMREDGLDILWRDKEVYKRHAQDLRSRLETTDANLDDLMERAGNIEHFLEATVDEFSRASELIAVEPLILWLDNMNIEVPPTAPGAREVRLAQIRVGRRRPQILQPVKFAPDFPRVDTGAALRRAARALGV